MHATFTVFWLNIVFIAVHSGERCGQWASGFCLSVKKDIALGLFECGWCSCVRTLLSKKLLRTAYKISKTGFGTRYYRPGGWGRNFAHTHFLYYSMQGINLPEPTEMEQKLVADYAQLLILRVYILKAQTQAYHLLINI